MFARVASEDSKRPALVPELGHRESPRSKNGFTFAAFDEEYVRRLTEGDPDIEQHFTEYFGKLLGIKLRARLHSAQAVEDIRQDTFLRVLTALRRKHSIKEPQHLGAFVNAVCNRRLLEYYRDQSRNAPGSSDVASEDISDERMNAESELVNAERMQQVRAVLLEMKEKDRELLRMVFYVDTERDEICRQLNTNQDTLRVLIHRAKARFRKRFLDHSRKSIMQFTH